MQADFVDFQSWISNFEIRNLNSKFDNQIMSILSICIKAPVRARAAARAMLIKADIMLLDEPTNHLDVTNVAWLRDYLTSLTAVTSVVVSHDPGFLQAVCTDIVYYDNRKLRHHRVRDGVLRGKEGGLRGGGGDPGFLQAVCTDIVNYDTCKLQHHWVRSGSLRR